MAGCGSGQQGHPTTTGGAGGASNLSDGGGGATDVGRVDEGEGGASIDGPAADAPDLRDAPIDVDFAGDTAADATAEADAATSLDAPLCAPRSYALNKVPPDVLMLLDRSGSMDELPDGTTCRRPVPPCGTDTKWLQMVQAVNQVVSATETTIRWGLSLFPSDMQCAAPIVVNVDVAQNSAVPIAAALTATMPMGITPTRLALKSAAEYLSNRGDANPHYIVLATDGLPNCGTDASTLNLDDSDQTIQAVRDIANKQGIPVFVIGVGQLADEQAVLSAMAVAGGEGNLVPTSYFPASSVADFVKALNTVTTATSPCSFGLGSLSVSPDALTVTAGASAVPRDTAHLNGWDVTNANAAVRLYGPWCDTQQGPNPPAVVATIGCPRSSPRD